MTSDRKQLLIIAGKAKRYWDKLEGYFANNTTHTIVKAKGDGIEDLLEEDQNLNGCVVIVDFDSIIKVDPMLLARKSERGKRIQVLVLVEKEAKDDCESLLRIGCMGFLKPDAEPWQFRRAVDAVSSGEIWAPRKFVSHMCRELLSSHDPRKLTAREDQVLALLAAGHSNREIADYLFISRDTVRWHMRAIYRKLGVHDRSMVLSFALVPSEKKKSVRKKSTKV
jgi:DNA-binding NarL/FixJ family response regulator